MTQDPLMKDLTMFGFTPTQTVEIVNVPEPTPESTPEPTPESKPEPIKSTITIKHMKNQRSIAEYDSNNNEVKDGHNIFHAVNVTIKKDDKIVYQITHHKLRGKPIFVTPSQPGEYILHISEEWRHPKTKAIASKHYPDQTFTL